MSIIKPSCFNLSDWFEISVYMQNVNCDWRPKHIVDIFVPWDNRYLNSFNQPVSPFVFALNCSALRQVSNVTPPEIVESQSRFLDFMARENFVSNNYSVAVRNNFNYNNFWVVMKKPWFGALMNAYYASGYMSLYESTKNVNYLGQAESLLKSVVNVNSEYFLSGFDNNGCFWFYEYVFETDDEFFPILKRLGAEEKSKKWRIRVFNGHITTLLIFLRFKFLASTNFFDDVILDAKETIVNMFSRQITADNYFSYSVEGPIIPDYGQRRAAQLLEKISECFDDKILKNLAIHFDEIYKNNIECKSDDYFQKMIEHAQKIYEYGHLENSNFQ